MSVHRNVRIKDSISTKLLKVVFSLYFLVALAVTMVHMVAEYYNTKDTVMEDLMVFEQTFKHAMATEVWNVDDEALESITRGVLEVPIIVGLKIIDTDDEEVAAKGAILDNGISYIIGKDGDRHEVSEDSVFSELLAHSFPLVFVTEDGEEIKVGDGTLYSSTEIVFQKVQYGFLFIIVNSIIKTIALWVIFLLVGRILLNKPLTILTSATEQLNMDNLEHLKINVKTSGRNELKILEEAFNAMVQKLLVAKERTASLRVFFSKIADFQDTTRMFNSALNELHRHMSLSYAVLFCDRELIAFIKTSGQNVGGTFLKKAPTTNFIESMFADSDHEILVFNSIQKEDPIWQFYADQQHIPSAGSHFAYIRVPTVDQHILGLFRNPEQPIFDSSDVEYIKSMLNEIKIAHHNINAIRQNARMEGELKTAAAVQYALFPKSLPQVRNLELACFFQSASETGGDWYGFATNIENSLFVLIGDVTGHGTPAALVAATASATCKTLEEMYHINQKVPAPSEVLQHLNRAVFEAGAPDFLMTFFVAQIDLDTGQMQFSNAGHNFPIVMRGDGTIQHALNTNCRLGNTKEWEFTEGVLDLQEGDLLFLYTDGLIENVNKNDEMWGERKLVRSLKKKIHLSAHDAVQEIIRETENFRDGHPPDDDVTIVACKVVAPFSKVAQLP